MNVHATALSLFLSLVVFAGCASGATKAREALADGKRVAARAPDQAATRFAEGARLDPSLHEAYARLARIRLDQARAGDAETAALRAASLVPRSSYYSELLGRAQLAGQKIDGALASLEQGITLDPAQTARLAFTIGVLCEQQGKPAEAQTSYERAATADASAVLPRLALARLHLRAERLDDAKLRLDEVRLHVPTDGAEHALFAQLDARVTVLVAQREVKRQAEIEQAAAAMNDAARGSSSRILRLLNALMADSPHTGIDNPLEVGARIGSTVPGDTRAESFGIRGLGLTGTGGSGGRGDPTIGHPNVGTTAVGSLGTVGHGGRTEIGVVSSSQVGGLDRRTARDAPAPPPAPAEP